MRPIPKPMREDMASDPFYDRCCITGAYKSTTKIEWHHNLIYAGKQVNEKWCILPLSQYVHDNIVRYKEKVDWIMFNRATDEDLAKFPKAVDNYKFQRERLNKKYGIPRKSNKK